MAELVQVSGSGVSSSTAPRRWTRGQSRVLGGLASLLGLSLVVAPTWYGVTACLIVTMIYASRTWPRAARFIVAAIVPNGAVWGVFIALRGRGNESPWVESTRLYVRHLEVWLFGGELPSSILQRHFFDPAHVRLYDYLLMGVHGSFFLVPSAVMFCLWWADSARFRRSVAALVVTLALGVICFALLPTNPPWMNPAVDDPNPVPVQRVNIAVAHSMGIESFNDDGNLAAETNPLAAMPSIHFAVTFLLLLAVWGRRKRWVTLAAVNVILMGLALVYLGEHQFLDEVVGAAFAGFAWWWAPRLVAWWDRRIETPIIASIGSRVGQGLGPALPGADAMAD